MPPPPPPSVFVYPFPRDLTGEALYDNITSGDHDYHFKGELELLQRFRAMPQAHPSEATLLLVPFMLVQAFTKLRKGLHSPGHAQLLQWDERVIAAMRAFGPYWDTRRRSHAVFAQRCAGPPSDRLRKASMAVHTWPSLWESNATLLCFEPATLTHMGKGILLPYGVGHGDHNQRCASGENGRGGEATGSARFPAAAATAASARLLAGGLGAVPASQGGGMFERLATPPHRRSQQRQRPAFLMFAGSTATNAARLRWVAAMRSIGEPSCKLLLFDKASRKRFSASALEASLQTTSFSLQLKGHVGPRKAIFDSVRCGSLLLVASERSPMPFADTIDYSSFGVQVKENANATAVLHALQQQYSPQRIESMRSAMLEAAPWLDYGPNGKLAEAVLARFEDVASGRVAAVPPTTRTPLPMLDLVK